MIVRKNGYLSGLLMVILLASSSIGFAAEGEILEQPSSWWQRARNLGSNSYDYASRGAQSAWNYAKPYTSYIPAAALAGLGAYGLGKNMELRNANQYLSPFYENLYSAAILGGLIGAPLAATSARYYNRQSQAPKERSSRAWDIAPLAIPAALALAYGPSGRKLNSAAWTALLAGAPALAYSQYLANEEKNTSLNQFKQIRGQLKNAVLANFGDKNQHNILFNDDNITNLISAYKRLFKLVQNMLPAQEKLSARAFIEQQLLNYMFDGGLIGANGYIINEDEANQIANKLQPFFPLTPASVELFEEINLRNPDAIPSASLSELDFVVEE